MWLKLYARLTEHGETDGGSESNPGVVLRGNRGLPSPVRGDRCRNDESETAVQPIAGLGGTRIR